MPTNLLRQGLVPGRPRHGDQTSLSCGWKLCLSTRKSVLDETRANTTSVCMFNSAHQETYSQQAIYIDWSEKMEHKI